jgi:hypothetical protein
MLPALSPPSVLRTFLAGASLVIITAGMRVFAATLDPILFTQDDGLGTARTHLPPRRRDHAKQWLAKPCTIT